MTTPVDPAAPPDGSGQSATTPDAPRPDADRLETTVGDAATSAVRPPWWQPARRLEHGGMRVLPGIWFPLVVCALWRLAHLAAVGILHLSDPDRYADPLAAAYHYDGERYLQILHWGYANPDVRMPNTAFFPGLSWFATPIEWLTGSNAWAVHLTATITALGAFVAVWGAVRAWKGERVARRAVVLMAVFPSSLFLWAFYSEALFVALGAGAVWADRRGRHGWAALALAGVATTRSVGILVVAVLVVARVWRDRRIGGWSVAYALAGGAGLALVLVQMAIQTGDPLAFVTVQEDWGRSLAPPWVALAQGYENLWPDEETIMVPARVARNFDLWAVGIALVGLGYLALSRRDRFPREAGLLAATLLVLPLSTSVLASINRFVLADWVLFAVYASWAGRLPPWTRRAATVVVFVAAAVVTWLMLERFAADRFVG